jgi:hypothetical protein
VQGYTAGDDLKQKFTGYERDGETGLDYAQAGTFYTQLPAISSNTIRSFLLLA